MIGKSSFDDSLIMIDDQARLGAALALASGVARRSLVQAKTTSFVLTKHVLSGTVLL